MSRNNYNQLFDNKASFNLEKDRKSVHQILISNVLSYKTAINEYAKTLQLKAFNVHSPKTISFFMHEN